MDNRKEVIEAFIAHELGLPLKYSNSEYDEMLAKVKAEDPSFNPFEYLPVPEDAETITHRSGLVWLEKYTPNNNDIREYWIDEDGKTKMPKYDGSSGVIYYTNGKLSHISSMGDKDTGIIQTNKFIEFVPQEVSEDISFIRFELLVDRRKYEGARGKANGLMNSKYLQDEINELATMVAFEVVKINGESMDWSEVPSSWNKVRDNGIPYFLVSPTVGNIELLDERGFARIKTDDIDFEFCIDGIVITKDKDYNMVPWCYKYDYLVSAKTKVLSHNWYYTNGEGWSCTLNVDPVELDNKMLRSPSSNGINNLLNQGLGVGAEVEVAFSGMTIPKVIRVITPVEPELPKCECDTQLTSDDIYGGVLKCSNPDCHLRYDSRLEWYNNLEDKSKEYLLDNLEYMVCSYLNIARWNWNTKRWNDFDTFKDELLNSILENNYEKFIEVMTNNYGFSYLQECELKLTSKPTIKLLNNILS